MGATCEGEGRVREDIVRCGEGAGTNYVGAGWL